MYSRYIDRLTQLKRRETCSDSMLNYIKYVKFGNKQKQQPQNNNNWCT